MWYIVRSGLRMYQYRSVYWLNQELGVNHYKVQYIYSTYVVYIG